jgi:hypothetical protein
MVQADWGRFSKIPTQIASDFFDVVKTFFQFGTESAPPQVRKFLELISDLGGKL